MNKRSLPILIPVLILCILCMSGTVESSWKDESPDRSAKPDVNIAHLENNIHALINKERSKKGLPALIWNERLGKVARRYSQDMVKRNFFSHNDPEGRSFYDRYKAAGFDCSIRRGETICMGAENIAQSNLFSSSFYRDGKTCFNWSTEEQIAESVLKQWMNSKGHKSNILAPYFRQLGTGVAFSDDGRAYITVNIF